MIMICLAPVQAGHSKRMGTPGVSKLCESLEGNTSLSSLKLEGNEAPTCRTFGTAGLAGERV